MELLNSNADDEPEQAEDADETTNENESTLAESEDAYDAAADPIAVAAGASVALSWFLFYVKGDKEAGIFVGLWAPTLLSAAGYFEQLSISETLEKGLSFR
ncbi:hypothetical protein [Natronorarus salvus]|uniref:hypothetical protein n=1 Tax=Natronorarus salvus TaxID=3117733 RepID=UPI002F26BE12